ncbi:DUF6881 domain-containing protein [Streptomyces sp. NPDC008150]|uniref:DUF6881 domain-containing protein n=1 Tax=Streptomyces sp. NPDC008150 TaxID=3364816 RepID=UPI0036E97F7C
MRYLKVVWHHNSPDDPVTIWSEIGEDGYESRKVEKFADGRLGYADTDRAKEGSELGEFPIPDPNVIAQQREFTPEIITAKAFEKKWNAATSVTKRRPLGRKDTGIRLTAKGGKKRTLGIHKTASGWSVVTAQKHRTIAVLASRKEALRRAYEILNSTNADPGDPIRANRAKKSAKMARSRRKSNL